MTANPLLFGGLTGVHAEAVVRQLELENAYIAQAGINPDAGRASNDNILDIIDIVQGDTNLANMANQGGVSGFTPFGDSLNPTPKYLDNDAQTNFWANFIAQSNSLGQQAIAAVTAHDAAATAAVIADLHTFQTDVTNFDAAQGGIFEARFDNELLGDTSTLGAEVTKMIEGLQTGNAALVGAAAEQMHANSADVGGNNIPVNGGTYNADGLTVADVLSTAGAPAAVAAVAPATAAAPAAAAPTAAAAPAATLAAVDAGTHDVAPDDRGNPPFGHSPMGRTTSTTCGDNPGVQIQFTVRVTQAKKQRADGPAARRFSDDRYCLRRPAAWTCSCPCSARAGAAGRLVAAPVVVPGWVLLRGVTSRMPGGAAGLAGCV